VWTGLLLKGRSEKKVAHSLWQQNFASSVHHSVMLFLAKHSERNCFHDKSQLVNTETKYSLFCRLQVNCSKMKLTLTSLFLSQTCFKE